jgi:glycosyltransferase involved in cell wall biosynthesis
VPPETKVERVPFASGFFGKVARLIAPEGHWLLRARSACDRLIAEHRPEAVITSSPPGCVHWLGRRLQKRHGLPWLADFRDPWAVNHARARWSDRRHETKVMRDANVLIANTPLSARGWAEAYPNAAHKIVTIPNGFDPERFAEQPSESSGVRRRLTILHAGELYGGRDPRPLLDALQQLRADLDVHIEFLGRSTEQRFDLPAELARRGLGDRVAIHDQAPYGEAIRKMKRADILLLIHTPGSRLGVPAKLYEYLGAGRPILALAEPDGDISWVLRESGACSRIAASTETPGIKQALLELIGEVKNGFAHASGSTAFTRERMAERFADCLNRCARTP